MARRRSRASRAFRRAKTRGRRPFNIGTGAGATAKAGAIAGGEGFAGFNFALTMDDSQFRAKAAEDEAIVDDISRGGRRGIGSRRRLSLGERLEDRVVGFNAAVASRLGLKTSSAVSGGKRASFLEFGSEGARVGDLRLSRSGISLSEKTFVGSKVMGAVAVAGQIGGHVIRAVASYDEVVRAHEGRPGPRDGEPTATASASTNLRVAGEFLVGGGFKIATQAAAIFGGEELGGLLLYGMRNLTGQKTDLRRSIRDAQENREAIAEALDFPKLLETYRKRAKQKQLANIKERQKVRQLWDGVRADMARKYGTDDEAEEAVIKNASEIERFRLAMVRDILGRRIIDYHGASYVFNTEGR